MSMSATPTLNLFQIDRRMRSLEQLLMEILKQQRQQEQLQLLIEILTVLKAQPVHQVQQEEWLDSMEVTRLYRISRSTLYRWKCKSILKPQRMGNRDIYLRRDLEHFLKVDQHQ